MFLLTLFTGFLLGALTIVVLEALGVLYVIRRLNRRVEEEHAKSSSPGFSNDLDTKSSLDLSSYYNKQGVVWVLELERIPKNWLADKVAIEKKRKKEILEVTPVRKHAKIKGHNLVLTESDGSHTEIRLKGCLISAVSATSLSSRKWAKRYPIKVESKTSIILNGSQTVYIYLETSWEKESWCKALRLASCDDKEKLKWFAQLNLGFQSYLTSLSTGYPSFMKPSTGFSVEPIDRSIKLDGSSSKVRHFLKKFARKASKSGVENKLNWTSTSGHGGRKINEKSFSFQDSVLASDSVKTAPMENVEENDVLSSSSSFARSGSKSHLSVISDADSEDKIASDEGTLCWNLLISRLFFDAKSNTQMKSSMQARIQRTLSNMRIPSYIGKVTCTGVDLGNLPPHIHGMRVLPSDMNEVLAFEVDIEYSGGAMLDIETRVEVCELEFEEGMGVTNSESNSAGEIKSDLLEGFEYFGEQLKLSEGKNDTAEQTNEGDTKLDGTKGGKNSTGSSSYASRWKSILNSVAKQVSQVPISLAIRVTSLRGTMRLYIKPPPSDQIWFGFISMPDIDFNLESSVGEHKITNGHIALFLISKLKAAIRETLVIPNCENIYIPWMLAEKDDWVHQMIAPFIWVKHEAVTDPSTVCEIPSSQHSDVTPMVEVSRATSTTGGYPESRHEKVVKEVDSIQEPINVPRVAHAPSSGPTNQSTTNREPINVPRVVHAPSSGPTNQSIMNREPMEELRTPLLRNEEPKETNQYSKEENPVSQSLSRSLILTEEQIHNEEEDDGRPKKIGTKARMLGLGKKMGEKLEERRRNIEEKGRHIVERMRGP